MRAASNCIKALYFNGQITACMFCEKRFIIFTVMASTTAKAVADFFLNFVHEHGDVLTNLKLQKLVYYAQAWHLALKGKPLFDDEFRLGFTARLCLRFMAGSRSIVGIPSSDKPDWPKLPRAIGEHLVEIFSVYGKYSAWDLERMTHQEMPWQKARQGLAPDDEGKQPISHKDMHAFYAKLAAKN